MQIRSIAREVEIPACSWGLPAADRVSFFVALNIHPLAGEKKKKDTGDTHGSSMASSGGMGEKGRVCACVIFSEALSLLS